MLPVGQCVKAWHRPFPDEAEYGCLPLVLVAHAWHPKSDVEALTSGIISTFIIRVGAAEVIVTRVQEAAHGFRVTKSREVHSGPCLVLLRGVSVGVGRSRGVKVEGEALVAS